jgi:hypothetical protein
MEKIILVNTVETSSQPSTEINEYGKVVKIAIADGQQVLFCQVVLAKDKTTAINTSYLEDTTKALERLLADAYTSVRGSLQVWYKRLCDRPNSAPGCKPSFIAYPVSTISRFYQQKIKVKIKLDIEGSNKVTHNYPAVNIDPQRPTNYSNTRLDNYEQVSPRGNSQHSMALYNKSDHCTQSSTN